jgi:hypothetical protein
MVILALSIFTIAECCRLPKELVRNLDKKITRSELCIAPIIYREYVFAGYLPANN